LAHWKHLLANPRLEKRAQAHLLSVAAVEAGGLGIVATGLTRMLATRASPRDRADAARRNRRRSQTDGGNA